MCCRATSHEQAELAALSLPPGQQELRCQSELAGSGIPGPPLQPPLVSSAAEARLPLASDVLSEAVESLSPRAARAAFLLSPSRCLMDLDETLQAHQLAGEGPTPGCSDEQVAADTQPSAGLSAGKPQVKRADRAQEGVAAGLLPAVQGAPVSGSHAGTTWVESADLQGQADSFSKSIKPRGSNHRQSVQLGSLDAAQQALEPLQHPESFAKSGGGSAATGRQDTLQESFEIKAGWLDDDSPQPSQRPIT